MGMGDVNPPYIPKRNAVLCNKCRHRFTESAVQHCPHPAVNRKYGDSICIYCCRGCKFVVKDKLSGAVGCGYIGEANE